jgi:hypothetical protein
MRKVLDSLLGEVSITDLQALSKEGTERRTETRRVL